MALFKHAASAALLLALAAPSLSAHPLDGLTEAEYKRINEILRQEKVIDDSTFFPLIELQEPPKAKVLAWKEGDALDRKASVQFTTKVGYSEAIVNITKGTVETNKKIDTRSGQPMILYTEFMDALSGVLGDPKMIAGLAKRGVKPEDALCLPLTAGTYGFEDEKGTRLMKVPCYQAIKGTNTFAKPIEGLFAVYDVAKKKILRVVDTGVVPVPKDEWGYSEKEIEARLPLRPKDNAAALTQTGAPNYKLTGSHLEWDIWRLNFRIDKRPGVVLSNLDVKDGDTWRSIIYQAHLSEVFVPYMDPSEGWFWRTYMDSGEYGFGLFLTPLVAGIDCPSYATFLPATISDDKGAPLSIPNAICIFERNIGDPAWRHFDTLKQSAENPMPYEGRPATELVLRSASVVGNYDYLIDYRLQQNGQINIYVGATGIDGVKGVASASMDDKTAKADTEYGTLIAPNLVAPNHEHQFNFRIDFDIDQPVNEFMTMDIVPAKVAPKAKRRSLWKVEEVMPHSEMQARYKLMSTKPRFFQISDPSRKGYLGHTPSYMIHHGNVAYSPFDFVKDPPMKRNAYVEYSVWNTVYDPDQRYAGGKYVMQGDGSDTLAEWVKKDRSLMGKDIVTWFTAGFHHVPRMEDWPVMSTDWKTIHIMPHNFFAHNPALTIRNVK